MRLNIEFLDFASKAKEAGITEAVLRGRVLSGKEACFTYVSGAWCQGSDNEFLPAWTREDFPFVSWTDHGSLLSDELNTDGRCPRPRYTIRGWVRLPSLMTEHVLISGRESLGGRWIAVTDVSLDIAAFLQVESPVEFEGQVIAAPDLYFPCSRIVAESVASPRRDANILRIVAALRQLLMDKDGGGFPSQARIIDLLSERHQGEEGFSKRNLETVFAQASRALQSTHSITATQGQAPQLR